MHAAAQAELVRPAAFHGRHGKLTCLHVNNTNFAASKRSQHVRLRQASHGRPSYIVWLAASLQHNQQSGRGYLLPIARSCRVLLPGYVNFSLSIKELSQLSLVSSILPALLLAVQPLFAAQPCITSSNALWQGPLRDMFSFTVLLGVFILSEPAAAVASAVSAAGGALALVCQHTPLPTAAAATAVMLAAAAWCTLVATFAPHVLGRTRAAQHQQQLQLTGENPRRCLMHTSPVTGHSCLQAAVEVSADQHHPTGTAAPGSTHQADCSSGSSSVQLVTHRCGGNTTTAAHGTAASSSSHSIERYGAVSPGQLQQSEQQQHLALLGVQQVLGVLGGGLLLQFVWSLARDQSVPQTAAAWVLPVAAGASAVLVAGRLINWLWPGSKELQQLQEDWPAWSATLLLILQPLHQLVGLALHPADAITEASVGQLVLLLLANGLMVPRAVLTHQFMWFTGTCSGAMLAAGQLVLMAAHSVSSSLQLLPLPVLLQGCSLPPAAAVTGAANAAGSWYAPFAVLMQWHNSSAPSVGTFTPDRPGLFLVMVLLLWLWLSLSVLQMGWRHVQSNQ